MEDKYMNITQKFYDDLASHYTKLFLDWNEAIEEEATLLDKIFKENGYTIVKTKTTRLTLDQAKQLYKVHAKEDFYSNLCYNYYRK